jgi:hypothetical protein
MAMILHCYSTSSFVQRSRDGDAESLLDLTPFMPLAYLYVFCYVLDVFLRLLVEI